MKRMKESFYIILLAMSVAVLTIVLCTIQALPTASVAVYGVEKKVARLLQEKVTELYLWTC
jgi:uncharacterized membrane protein YsdA (DUF1294 family)